MACDDLITNQDLENAKKDATTMSDFVESDSPEIQSKNGKNIRTLHGINDAADNLISSLGGTDIGDYEDDLTLNSYNEYVVFDRAGATTGPSLWKAIPPRAPTPGTPLPYTIDSTTYPDPTSDTNIEPFSDINKAGAEQIAQEEANAGDSQLAGGNIWPLSSQESAQDGDDLTGYDFVRLQGGDFPSITLFPILRQDGSNAPLSGNLSNINLTSKPYSATVGVDDIWLQDIRYCGLPVNGFPSNSLWLVGDDSTFNTDQLNAVFSYTKTAGIGSVFTRSGRYVTDEVQVTDQNLNFIGESRSSTLFINTGTGSVFNFTRPSGDFKIRLKLESIGLNRPIDEGVHTASGSHAIFVENYNDLQVEDILIFQAGGAGIYATDIFVQTYENIFGSHCGQNAAISPETLGVIHYERVSTGNSIRITDSYISNSLSTNAVRINNAQSITIQNTTLESCIDLISIGTLGNTSRNVTIDTCYFENPNTSCGNFVSIFGLQLKNLYCNLVGPQSDVVFRNFRFEECDRVDVYGCSLGDPDSMVNPNYRGALEFVTGSSLSYKGQVTVKESTSMNTVCIDSNTSGRSTQELRVNRCGIDIYELRGLEAPASNLLPNTDLLTWTNPGALPIVSRPYYDGSDEYVVSGDNSSTINTSFSINRNSGDPVNFSAFVSGACRLQIRGRRVSDSGFETVATLDKIGSETGSNVGGDLTRRVYVSGQCLNDYDLFNVIFRPDSYDVAIAYPQFNDGLTPTDYK